MAKAIATKEALKAWEEKMGKPAGEEHVIKLHMWQPLINKMDASLGTLSKVEHLGLSTNLIEKISNLQGLRRNNIKKIEGLDAVADSLEELWISYNQIERLNGVECCKKLKVLYVSHNRIKAWEGLATLKDMPMLENLLLTGNPLEEKLSAEGQWRDTCTKNFPQIKRLDGQVVFKADPEPAPGAAGNPNE